MKNRAGNRFRSTARSILASTLPPGASQAVLKVWRRLYWWDKSRIRPSRSRRVVGQLLSSGNPIKLELGAGPRTGMEAWVSLDLSFGAMIQHDLTRPLPFPDRSVEEVYSSHVLEHFTYPNQLLPLLRECLRVLKPGGKFRAAVPNARLYLEGYFHPDRFDRRKFCAFPVGLNFESRIDVVNFIAYLGGEHKFLFDDENLPRVLEEAGFMKVQARPFDPTIDLEERRHESLYIEAIR
ncbi:MAG: methyltransferase domain-containing protein [Acidobacteriota bacterium]